MSTEKLQQEEEVSSSDQEDIEEREEMVYFNYLFLLLELYNENRKHNWNRKS